MNASPLGCILVPIDFIITRCQDKMDIHNTRAMRAANCWTDHQMLRSKVAFKIRQKHKRQGTSKPTKLNTATLSTISHSEIVEQEMDSALAQWEEKEILTSDEESAALQQVVYNTAKTYLGNPDRTWSGLVRPKRPGATDSYEQKRPSPPESVTNQSTRYTNALYKDARRLLQKTHPCTEVRLVGKEGSGTAESC